MLNLTLLRTLAEDVYMPLLTMNLGIHCETKTFGIPSKEWKEKYRAVWVKPTYQPGMFPQNTSLHASTWFNSILCICESSIL